MEFYSVDIIYWLALTFLIMTALIVHYGRLNLWIGLVAVFGALVIAYLWSPYSTIVTNAVAGSLWYGYDFTFLTWAGLIHMGSVITATGIAIYNLYITFGRKIWL